MLRKESRGLRERRADSIRVDHPARPGRVVRGRGQQLTRSGTVNCHLTPFREPVEALLNSGDGLASACDTLVVSADVGAQRCIAETIAESGQRGLQLAVEVAEVEPGVLRARWRAPECAVRGDQEEDDDGDRDNVNRGDTLTCSGM